MATKFAMLLGIVLSAGSLDAADEKKPAAKPAETATDWTKYAAASEVQGEIVKLEKNGFLLKIPGPPQQKTTGTGNNRRVTTTPGKAVQISFAYIEGSQIRWAKLAPKIDSNGKKVLRTAEEIAEFKKPAGVPGFLADPSDLKVGQILDLILVRPREIPAAKATQADLIVKRATILGEDPNAKPAEAPKKKKAD